MGESLTSARNRTIAQWSAGVVVVAPLVIALVRVLFGRPYVPSGDTALIEMNVRDISRHLPLLGVYSRFGWNHPGPALYYVLEAPYRLFGDASRGLLAGALVLNIAAIVVAALVARRVAGAVGFYGALGAAVLLVHGLGSANVMSPWNPEVPVLPTLVVLVSAWAVACDHPGALPLLAIVATFVVQAHVGYLPLVAALTAAALCYFVAGLVRAPERRAGVLGWAGGAVGGLFVMWLLPVIQQVTHHPGNMQLLEEFSRKGGDRSLLDGFKIVASEYAPGAPWFTHSERANPFTGEMVATRWQFGLLTLGLLVAALVVVCRRRAHLPRPLVRLVVLLAVSVPVEVYAVTKIVGPAYAYLVQWLWVTVVATWLVVFWLIAALWPRTRTVVAVVVAIPLVVVAAANFVTASGATRPDSGPLPGIARTFSTAAIAAARDAKQPVRVEGVGGIDAEAYAEGVQLQLSRAGIRALAPDVPLMHLKLAGDRIDHGNTEAQTVFTVVGGPNNALGSVFGQPNDAGRAAIEEFRRRAGVRELSTVEVPPTASEHAATQKAVDELVRRGVVTSERAAQIVADDARGRQTYALFVE